MHAEMEGKKDKSKATLFVINMFAVYLGWKLFSYYVKHSSGFLHNDWDHVIYFLGSVYASITAFILNSIGENATHSGIAVFYPEFRKTILVADHCLAIPATIIFIGTIVLFEGDWRNKLWFVPMGVMLIILINLVRLVLLCYIFAHYPLPFYEINHSLVYVVLTYALIFLLIVWWMKKFAYPKANSAFN